MARLAALLLRGLAACSALTVGRVEGRAVARALQPPAFTADGRRAVATTTPGPYASATFPPTTAAPPLSSGISTSIMSPWTPMPAPNPILAHGEEVEVQGLDHQVVHLPTPIPTLTPERNNNHHPVQSEAEQEFEMTGPTPRPEKDCIRAPELSQCECREMTNACAEEVYECEVHLNELQRLQPEVMTENYKSKFDHPLLNTMFLEARARAEHAKGGGGLRTARRLRRATGTQPAAQCRQCFSAYAESLRAPPAEASALLEEIQIPVTERAWRARGNPPTSGHRLFPGNPHGTSLERGEVMHGDCQTAEVNALRECMTYFWACDGNRKRLNKYISETEGETEWTDAHAASRPGLWSPARR